MRPIVCLLVVATLATACAQETPESATPESLEPPATIATSRATTTMTTVAETTTTVSRVVELPEIGGFADRRDLDVAKTYRVEVEGLEVLLTPPAADWELLGYVKSGSDSGALFGWAGPNGFRPETLDVLIWDVGDDGPEAAWGRVDSWLETAVGGVRSAGEFQWLDEGVGLVAGREAEWREVRSGSTDWPDNTWRALAPFIDAGLFAETSARFYVVPAGDLTVTVVGYETRCACQGDRGDTRLPRVNQRSDDIENELSMWIPELEAFLAAMSFQAP